MGDEVFRRLQHEHRWTNPENARFELRLCSGVIEKAASDFVARLNIKVVGHNQHDIDIVGLGFGG
jgi:hypothetical protein